MNDLRVYRPPDEAFHVFIRALIGPTEGPGQESFDFDVCSPAWLSQELEHDQVICGRFCLFMADFSYEAVERYVFKRVAQATGSDWKEIAGKLGRWSRWEFEDYAEYQSRA